MCTHNREFHGNHINEKLEDGENPGTSMIRVPLTQLGMLLRQYPGYSLTLTMKVVKMTAYVMILRMARARELRRSGRKE